MGSGNEIHKAKIMLATDALIYRGERGSINSYSRWPRGMTWRLLSSGKEAPRNPEFMFRSGLKTTSGCRCVNRGWPWTSSCSPCTEMLPSAAAAAVAAPTVVVVAIIISLFSAPVLLIHSIGFWTLDKASDPKKGITNRRQFAPEFQQLPPLHKSRREAEEVDHCLRHGCKTSNSFADSRVPAAATKTLLRECIYCMDSLFKVSFLCFFPFFLAFNANTSQQESFWRIGFWRFPKGILQLTICDCAIIEAHANDAGNLILTRSGSGRRADHGRELLEHMCLGARLSLYGGRA